LSETINYLLFHISDLDLGLLGMGFGLLKMPKMPEIKGKTLSSFVEDSVEVNGISYR
jgi:ATP-dependent RNA helicase DDX55/SPB4